MPTRTYTVTPAQITAFRAQLVAHDIKVPAGNDGQIAPGWGVLLGFHYDGTSTLTLTIIKTGWGNEEEIWGDIAPYIPQAA